VNSIIHSLLVFRNGFLVADAYFYPFSSESRHKETVYKLGFDGTFRLSEGRNGLAAAGKGAWTSKKFLFADPHSTKTLIFI